MNRFWQALLITTFFLAAAPFVAKAQTETPAPTPTPERSGIFIHEVLSGENLTVIAETYDVSVADLMLVNHFDNNDILNVGQPLVIPGGLGPEVATVYRAELGDSLPGIATRYQTTVKALTQTSRLINPYYTNLDLGQALPLISHTGTETPQLITGRPHLVAAGESILTIAAHYGVSVAALAEANGLTYRPTLFPGQRLRIPGDEAFQFLPGEWAAVQLRPYPILQGATVSVYVENFLDGTPTGQFGAQSLRFVPQDAGYAAVVGIDAFTEPGGYNLTLTGQGEQSWTPYEQTIPIFSANFNVQSIDVEEDLVELLDPQIRLAEDNFLRSIYAQDSGAPMWEGLFQAPITNTVTARYGDGRSYNGGPVYVYHSGIDFDGSIGTPIMAPADGTVIYHDWLTLRGQSLIVDHGLGVMTGYYHLSDLFVTIGDEVTAGQTIAAGGSTGLSTGPHLHWDLRIMGIPVNGLQWLEHPFP